MKTVAKIILLTMILTGCTGSVNRTKPVKTENKKSGQPHVTVKVNKQYDKKGNLVSFDSTYSAFYSGRQPNGLLNDSMMNSFKTSFSKEFPLINSKAFNKIFFTDSLLYSDFFHADFFSKRFELNQAYLNEVMKEMDSVKNAFFKRNTLKKQNEKVHN